MNNEEVSTKSVSIRLVLVGLISLFMVGSIVFALPADPFKFVLLVLLFLCGAAVCGFVFEVADMPLLLLIMGTLSFGRDFSLMAIQVKGIPLYVTETAIAASVALLFMKGKKLGKEWTLPLPGGLAVSMSIYFLLGIMYVVIGVKGNGAVAFRDVVFCLYLAIVVITLSLLNKQEKLQRILKYLIPAAVIILFISLLLFFARVPGGTIYRQITNNIKMTNIGLYCGLILTFGFSYFTFVKKKIYRYLLGFIVYLSFLFVIMAEVRAAWVGLLTALIILGILLKKEFKIFKFIFVLMIVSFFIIDYFDLGVQKNKLSSMGQKVVSVTSGGERSVTAANIKWRLGIWKETVREIKEYPIFGWGYGIQIDYTIWGNSLSLHRAEGSITGAVPPHNHLLAITYKMGLFGLILFLFINARVFFYGWSYVKKCKSEYNRRFLIASLAGLVFWHGMAFFFDVLESPPTGIFLWILLGSILAVINNEKE